MQNNLLGGFRLNNRVAIITGTTKGIGESLAEALAKPVPPSLPWIVPIIRIWRILRRPGNTVPACSNRSGEGFKNDIEKVVDFTIKEFSHIDILVNNAGISRRGDIPEFSENDWLDVLKVNLTAPFHLSQAVAKSFIPRRTGKIINIASMLSFQGGIRVPSYASSKHGIVGLTRSFAVALGAYGINVNAIAPGFMATDLTMPLQQNPERNDSIIKRIPLGRWGNGNDLKGALIFLASSMSDYVNGAVIPVDGGWLTS